MKPYEVLRVYLSNGLRVRILWHAGLTFHIHAQSRHATEREVGVFTHQGVVASFEHAEEIAKDWWTHQGAELTVLSVSEDYPELLGR